VDVELKPMRTQHISIVDRYKPKIGQIWEVVYYVTYIQYFDRISRPYLLTPGTKIILGKSGFLLWETLVNGVYGTITAYDLYHSCRPCHNVN